MFEGLRSSGRAVLAACAGPVLVLLLDAPPVALALAAFVAFSAVTLTAGRPAAGFGRALAAAALGQGLALSLLGSSRWQQHPLHPTLLGDAAPLVAAQLAYAAALLGVAWRRRAAWGPRIGEARRPLAALGLVAVAGAAIAHPFLKPWDPVGLVYAFAVGGAWTALGVAQLLWLADEAPPWAPSDGMVRVAAGLGAVASAVFGAAALDHRPQLEDSVALLWQARHLADGHLFLPAPPVAESFAQYLIVDDGTKWFGYSPLGWPLVLAAGVALGAEWGVNPVLGLLSVLLVQALLRKHYGAPTANAAAFLLAVSPWFVVMNATLLAHPLTLLVGLVAIAATRRATGGAEAPLWAGALAGLAIGAMTSIRTLDALVLGAVLAAWGLGRAGPGLAPRLRFAGPGAVTGAAMAALTLAYNAAATGSASTFPNVPGLATKYDARINRLGFGDDIGFGWGRLDPLPGHGPLDALLNANHNLYFVSFETVAVLGGGVALAIAAVILGARLRRADGLWLALPVVVMLAYSAYWFSGGPDFGAKYWYLSLPCAVAILGALLARAGAGAPAGGWLLAAAALSVGLVLPWRALDKYDDRAWGPANLPALEARFGWDDAVIFVGGGDEVSNFGVPFLRTAMPVGAPGPIYARDVDPATNAALLEAVGRREAWILRPPEAKGEPFRVLRSPRDAGPVDDMEPSPHHPR